MVDVLVGLGLFGIFAFLFAWSRRAKRHYEGEVKARLERCYSQLEGDIASYRFFTTGHPEVWIERPKLQIEKAILRSCDRWYVGSIIPIYGTGEFSFKAHESARSVYLVPGTAEFDFSSRVHYEEWVSGRKP